MFGVNAQISIAAVWKSLKLPCMSLRMIWLSNLLEVGCFFHFLPKERCVLQCSKRLWLKPQFVRLHRKPLSVWYVSRAKCSQVSHILPISGLRLSIATLAFTTQFIKGSPIIEVIVNLVIATHSNCISNIAGSLSHIYS